MRTPRQKAAERATLAYLEARSLAALLAAGLGLAGAGEVLRRFRKVRNSLIDAHFQDPEGRMGSIELERVSAGGSSEMEEGSEIGRGSEAGDNRPATDDGAIT